MKITISTTRYYVDESNHSHQVVDESPCRLCRAVGPEQERYTGGASALASLSALRPPSGWTKWVHHPSASDAPTASFPNSLGGQTCQGSVDWRFFIVQL